MKTVFQVQEVGLKYGSYINVAKKKIGNSSDAADFLRTAMNSDLLNGQEMFLMVCLNRDNKVIAYSHCFTGGATSVVVDPKVIFRTALLSGATSIIVGHNHPSGNLNPSDEDCRMTKRLVDAGKALALHVVDHLIITEGGHYSFADEGQI